MSNKYQHIISDFENLITNLKFAIKDKTGIPETKISLIDLRDKIKNALSYEGKAINKPGFIPPNDFKTEWYSVGPFFYELIEALVEFRRVPYNAHQLEQFREPIIKALKTFETNENEKKELV